MGGGKGSSSGGGTTTVQLTPEQRETIGIQNAALRDVFMPAYTNTVGGAANIYNQTAGNVSQQAANAINTSNIAGGAQGAAGLYGLGTGMAGLGSLFSPDYKDQQVQAALQAGREATREQLGQQNAMYGGAGGLGSARQALADTNLRQLGEQRQATAAAAASAGVEANRAAAANQLATLGMQGLGGAQQSAAANIGYAGAPQDTYSKYASIVFGVPQASTTPNYAGTQGQTNTGQSQSKGFGFKV